MPENVLKVRMLGNFSLCYGGKEITLDENTDARSIQLLQLILVYVKSGGVAGTSLADSLYGKDEAGDKNLDAVVLDLRKRLRSAGLPEGDYVVSRNGIYRWDESIPVEVDAVRFEELIRQGKSAEEISKKMELFQEACRIYTGEFLPDMIGREWATVRNIYYQELYSSALLTLLEWLSEKEQHEDVYRLSSAAADIYPFEDWALWQIDSLIAMSRFREARAVYEKTAKLFFDEFGLLPSPELVSRSRIMADRSLQPTGVIQDIRKRLREKEKVPGAYYCTYPGFVDVYHILCRIMERNGMSAYILLCTLQREQEGPVDEIRERRVSVLLKKAIMSTLRRGDFYTKYNQRQYLVMLPGINQENCIKVSERIDDTFGRLVERDEYQVSYYITSVAENEDIAADQPELFRRDMEWL